MRNGLYKAIFQTPLGGGMGVAYLHDGKVHGGDGLQYYVGDYQVSGDTFTANVASRAHSQVPGQGSVFGVDTANMTLTGTFQGDHAKLKGTAKEAPGINFTASLTRIAD